MNFDFNEHLRELKERLAKNYADSWDKAVSDFFVEIYGDEALAYINLELGHFLLHHDGAKDFMWDGKVVLSSTPAYPPEQFKITRVK